MKEDKILQENENNLYKEIAELNPNVIFLSCDNKFVFANKKALKLIKAESIEELQPLSTIDIVHPRYRNKVAGRRPSSISEKFSLNSIEVQIICIDRSVVNVEMESSVFAFGDKLYTMSTLKEIDKTKDMQRAYMESDVLVNAIFDSTIDGILVIDDKGRIININNRFIDMWDISEENLWELDESTALKLVLKNLQKPEQLASIFARAESVVNEYFDYVRFNDGRVFNLYSCPLIIEGEITGRIWSFRDITKQAEAEEKLNKSNNDLKEALEKLKETQAQLIQSEKLAGIGQLAAGVAHEINNPLAYTISNIDMLQKRIATSSSILSRYRKLADNTESFSHQDIMKELNLIKEQERKSNFNYIIEDMDELIVDSIEGLKKAGSIVSRLRDFSGRHQADIHEKYNLNEGIESTLAIIESEIKVYAEVEKDLKKLPFIKANSGQINQVIMDMLQNSVRAIELKGEGGKGAIKINTYMQDKYIVCEIEDNGIGIEEENIKKIFLPFYTTRDVGEGSGLGLSMAYDIITNKHKGEITVESEPFQWTKFTIRLPI